MRPIQALRIRTPSAGYVDPSWIPTALGSTLIVWLDAATLSGAANSRVDTWPDRSSNGWDATRTAGTLTPRLAYSDINGLKTVAFHESGEGTTMTWNSSLMVGKTAGCFFCVIRRVADPPATDADAGPPVGGFTSDAGSTKGAHVPYTDSNIYEHFGTTVRKTVGNPSPSLTSPRIYSAHCAASDYRVYLDGTSIFSTTTNTVGFGSSITRTLGYGLGNIGANYFGGVIGEVVMCDTALSTGDREKVEGYLAWKWGLAANLPSGHTYKSAPPT